MNNLLIYNKLMLNDRCMQLETGHRFNQPAFAVVSIYSNANWGAQAYNHNLQKATATHRYNSAHKTYNASELANTYYGGSTTNSTTSSGANRGNGTSMVGHLGHNCLQIAADGTFSFAINTNDTQTNVGTWVHNTTPHLTINMSNGDLWISKRSYAMTDRSVFGKPQSALGLNDVKRAGTLCYNERTRKLAILESDGSYKHRLNVWDKIKSPQIYHKYKDTKIL